MNAWFASSLAVLLAAVGSAGPAPTSATRAPAPLAKGSKAGATVTVHRCVDAKGRVTLQDESCPPGSHDSTREMQRPKDPPPRQRTARASIASMPPPTPEPEPVYQRELIPPPPMYQCTSYDGISRFSESYDPNPRCEPLVLYYPLPDAVLPTQQLGCRWVEDSCVRLSDQAACQRFRDQRKEAVSLVTRAFSDTATYRKSELARLTQIVDESCP